MSDGPIPELPGLVASPRISGLPTGYRYGVTRYADVILEAAFPDRFADLVSVLSEYEIAMSEIVSGGGGRATHTRRFDEMLYERGWHKRNVTISKLIDDDPIHRTRGHEIDVFASGEGADYPGVALEVEWNNKDPFFHRDLTNFMALHREGAIAVGVIVTRGPQLQKRLEKLAAEGHVLKSKYGASTTHWNKLVPIVDLGGGGECPLLLVGIEPDRVAGWI